MKPTKRHRTARIFPGVHIIADEPRRPIVELDTRKNSIAIRLEGCSSRNTFPVADLQNVTFDRDTFTITTAATVAHAKKDHNLERRPLTITVNVLTGEVAVQILGIRKGRKRYELADLYHWGAQQKLL